MEFETFREALMSLALQKGFTDCEVYYQQSRDFETLIQEGEVAHIENSSQQGACFRGTYLGQMGYAYSEEFSQEAITFLIEEAAQNASIVKDKQTEMLYAGSAPGHFEYGYNPALNEIAVSEKIQAAKKMEASALDENDDVAAIDYCVLSFHEETVQIKNSLGLDLSNRMNHFSAYVCALAQQNGDTKTGSDYFISNKWSDFHPETIGQIAAKRAAACLGAYAVRSGDYRILLENQVAANLLSVFCGIFYGENVEKGFSLLKDKLHEKIASPKVTLRDDAFLPDIAGTIPFDNEGVPCQNKAIIENGRLCLLLHNTKTARAANTQPTGNGFKPTPQAPVKTACTHLYIAPGQKTPRTLMAQLGEGLLITDISGLHAGANPVSGDFSLSAEGFLLERGQIIRPVEQITIAGNFYALLKNIEETGNDLRFLPPRNSGVIGAPMLMIKKLSIAGN